jgi:histidinol-phosphate aminotransferase
MRPLFAPHFSHLVTYVPGKPVEETEREYGVTDVAKLASNESCLGASPRAVAAMQQAVASAHRYPDADGFYLKRALLRRHGLAREASGALDGAAKHLALGNGTSELIALLARALLGEGEAMVAAWPSFVCYRMAARALGRQEIAVPLDGALGYDLERLADAARDPRAKLVFLANPNNPTGRSFSAADLDAFFARVPADVVVVLDEAYAEYVRDASYPDGVAWALRRPRTVALRTFSKIFGLAALRLGYAVGDPAVIDAVNRLRDPFNTNAVSQAGAIAALEDVDHVRRVRAYNDAALPRLERGLTERGFDVAPSQGNFVLASLRGPFAAWKVPDLNVALLKRGVIVRPVANYDLHDAVRISVGTDVELAKLFGALDALPAPVAGGKPSAARSEHHQQPRRGDRGLIVALDGPAGAGKSTVAKRVAERAGLTLVDTGAIYRAVALLALRSGTSPDDAPALAALAADLATKLRFRIEGTHNRVLIGDEDVSAAIRTPEVSALASSTSRHAPVRRALLELQRSLGRRSPGAVLEGRDIGTVVFPDADVKAFVTASPEERARRRHKELAEKGTHQPYEAVLDEIVQRDKQDSERAEAPLKPAPDAAIVDTTGKTLDAVVEEILALVARRRA